MNATKIHCQTLDTNSSRFPWLSDRGQIANVLQYDPEGDTVAQVLAALDSGREVDVYGADGVNYLFKPTDEQGQVIDGGIGRKFRRNASPVDYTINAVAQ